VVQGVDGAEREGRVEETRCARDYGITVETKKFGNETKLNITP